MNPRDLAEAEARRCPTEPNCDWLLHRHLCQFSAAESIPTHRSDRGGVAAEEERDNRGRRGGSFDSLCAAFAFHLVG